jgi:hypothetical protein
MESKSKQEASKINEQDVIKIEIKDEYTSNDFEHVKSQKNMEDIPVLQRNYNDQPDRCVLLKDLYLIIILFYIIIYADTFKYLLYVINLLRYNLWLHGKDISPHPEEPRQTAAPMSSLIDLSCSNSRNSELLHSYLNAILKNKQHTIHKEKSITSPSVNISEFMKADIPPEVKKALQDLENEEQEDHPQVEVDRQQFDWFEYMLKDIWLKTGEILVKLTSVYIFIFVIINLKKIC